MMKKLLLFHEESDSCVEDLYGAIACVIVQICSDSMVL